MNPIELTDTIRGFLSPEGADAVIAAPTAATRDISIKGQPPVHWRLDQKHNALRCYLHLFAEKPVDGPLYAALEIDLPEHTVIQANIAEEHCWLTVQDDGLWTVADLCMIDANTFYSLECLLSMIAYQRVATRLRAENPHGWRTWQRWPAREFAGSDPTNPTVSWPKVPPVAAGGPVGEVDAYRNKRRSACATQRIRNSAKHSRRRVSAVCGCAWRS